MTLSEVLAQSEPFYREAWNTFIEDKKHARYGITYTAGQSHIYSAEDLTATDWQIVSKTVSVSKDDLHAKLSNTISDADTIEQIATDLGL